jgi:hypothetical protein
MSLNSKSHWFGQFIEFRAARAERRLHEIGSSGALRAPLLRFPESARSIEIGKSQR